MGEKIGARRWSASSPGPVWTLRVRKERGCPRLSGVSLPAVELRRASPWRLAGTPEPGAHTSVVYDHSVITGVLKCAPAHEGLKSLVVQCRMASVLGVCSRVAHRRG